MIKVGYNETQRIQLPSYYSNTNHSWSNFAKNENRENVSIGNESPCSNKQEVDI